MAAEVPIDLTYAIYSLLFEGGSYDWTKLLDPWGIFGIAGRPHDEATEEVINRLLSSPNAAARLWGIELARGLDQFDLTISTSGSGRQILNAWFAQFVGNMAAQGVDKTRAQEIGLDAMSRAAQAGSPLPPELQQQIPPGLTFAGPQAIADTFLKGISIWNKQGFKGLGLVEKAENYTLKNSTVADLTKLQIRQPDPNQPQTLPVPTQGGGYVSTDICQPGFTFDVPTELCWPIPPTPPPGQICPPGMHWDLLQLKCVPDTVPPPGPIPPPGGNNGPDPDGDEITNTLCAQIQAAADRIIQAMSGASGGGGAPVDFTAVVNAIEDCVSTLAAISTALTTLAPVPCPPTDLSGVIGALDSLVTAIGGLAAPGTVDLTPLVDALNNIAAKIPAGGATDVSGIVQKLQQLFDTIDVPMPVYQSLADNGYIDSTDLQLLAPGPFGAGLIVLLEKYGEKALLKLSHFLGIDWVGGVPVLTPTATRIMDTITAILGKLLIGERDAVKLITDPILARMNEALQPTGTPNLGNVFVDADQVLADVATVTLNGMLVAILIDALREGAGKPIEKFTELFGGLIGLEELREVQIGPKISYGIAAVAEMAAKARYQQSLPNAGSAADWRARGILNQNDATTLFRFNGFNADIQKWMETGAYSGLNPRMLIRLINSGLYSEGEIVDEMTFAGVRPASQQRLVRAMPWLATQAERKQLESTLEKAHIQGLIADADLAQEINGLDQNTDRNALILQRANLEKRLAYAKEIERGYTQEFFQGVFGEPQYRSLLEGLGLQADFINARVAADEAQLTARLTRQATAEERALIRATAAEERRAAVKNFTTGNIDAIALTAALVLTGLTPAQAAAWVDLAVLQKGGSLRWIFGLQKSPSDAALLRARVSALSDQRKRLQISDAAFVQAIQALGISASYANAIRASVDAMITPKASAVTIPVETK